MSCPLQSGLPAELSRKGWELTNAGETRNGLACHKAATALPAATAYDWFHRSRAEQVLGLNEEAEASLSRATTMKSPRLEAEVATEAYFQLGKVSRDLGKTVRAEAAYRQSVKLAPGSPGAHVMLGVTLREMGRLGESLDAYSTGLAIRPAIPAAQYNRAQALLSDDRKAEALAGLAVAVHLDPQFALAYEAMGEQLVGREREREAAHVYRSVTLLQPRSATAYYNLGKHHFNAQRLAQSIKAHRRALKLQPNFAYVHNDIGNALSDATGRSDEVFYHYSSAARLMPSFAEAWSNVGTVLKDRGQHQEASDMFARAIQTKPTLCEAYKNLGSCYGETARMPEAVVAYEGALRINPQFWPALYALLDMKQFLCDWRNAPQLYALLVAHLQDLHGRSHVGAGPDERMHGGLAPFMTLVWPLPVETQLSVTVNRARKDVSLAASSPLMPPLRWASWALQATPRLRIGFISSDFGDHPVGHALLPWLQALRRRTQLLTVCFGSDASEKRHAGTPLRRQIAEGAPQSSLAARVPRWRTFLRVLLCHAPRRRVFPPALLQLAPLVLRHRSTVWTLTVWAESVPSACRPRSGG